MNAFARFLQERQPVRQPSLAQWVEMARHQDYGEFWAVSADGFGQFQAVHAAGHCQVGDNAVHAHGRLENCYGRVGVFRFEHPVTQLDKSGRILGSFPNPEDLAFARPAPKRALYHVLFEQKPIWGEGCPGDEVLVEIFEHWLEPAEAEKEAV